MISTRFETIIKRSIGLFWLFEYIKLSNFSKNFPGRLTIKSHCILITIDTYQVTFSDCIFTVNWDYTLGFLSVIFNSQ